MTWDILTSVAKKKIVNKLVIRKFKFDHYKIIAEYLKNNDYLYYLINR